MSRLVAIMALAIVTLAGDGRPVGVVTAQGMPAFTPQAHANLAQLMRVIPFTSANVVFEAQVEDPGAPGKATESGASAARVYRDVFGGWQQVENSALALSESAALMMLPGRLCQNGKPVPVNDEQYRQGAEALVAAGRAAYKAAQSKDQDAIVDVSGRVASACASCHEPYRDVDNPADRCTSRK
jgi:hypothetical protein